MANDRGFLPKAQRFIEAFGIVPDHWHEGAPSPFRALVDDTTGGTR